MSEVNDLPGYAVEPHDASWPDHLASTGDGVVDSTLERLSDIRSVPVAEHRGIYAEIHGSLMAALDTEDR
ncbi:hypothetical protein GCM10023063_28740 [Arthrobacter methylotrophus]|uniref:Uncharacterized protein n=1 Tax=Arthrobacter methylotrophus TaxID=121291 RepID=A0ABV5UQL8_9MICC